MTIEYMNRKYPIPQTHRARTSLLSSEVAEARIKKWAKQVPEPVANLQVSWELEKIVVRLRRQGLSYANIARKFEIKPNRAREIYAEWELKTDEDKSESSPVELYLKRGNHELAHLSKSVLTSLILKSASEGHMQIKFRQIWELVKD